MYKVAQVLISDPSTDVSSSEGGGAVMSLELSRYVGGQMASGTIVVADIAGDEARDNSSVGAGLGCDRVNQ